jgi:hypothetical protein
VIPAYNSFKEDPGRCLKNISISTIFFLSKEIEILVYFSQDFAWI